MGWYPVILHYNSPGDFVEWGISTGPCHLLFETQPVLIRYPSWIECLAITIPHTSCGKEDEQVPGLFQVTSEILVNQELKLGLLESYYFFLCGQELILHPLYIHIRVSECHEGLYPRNHPVNIRVCHLPFVRFDYTSFPEPLNPYQGRPSDSPILLASSLLVSSACPARMLRISMSIASIFFFFMCVCLK